MANLKNNQKSIKRKLLEDVVITEYKSSFEIYQEHWETALPTRKQFAETYNKLAAKKGVPTYKQQDTNTFPSYPSFSNALNTYANEQNRVFQIDISCKRTEQMILFYEDIIFLMSLKKGIFTQEDLICFISPHISVLDFKYDNLYSILIHCEKELFTKKILEIIKNEGLDGLEIKQGILDLLVSFNVQSTRDSYFDLLQHPEYDKSYFQKKLDYKNPLIYDLLCGLIKNYNTVHPPLSVQKV